MNEVRVLAAGEGLVTGTEQVVAASGGAELLPAAVLDLDAADKGIALLRQ